MLLYPLSLHTWYLRIFICNIRIDVKKNKKKTINMIYFGKIHKGHKKMRYEGVRTFGMEKLRK